MIQEDKAIKAIDIAYYEFYYFYLYCNEYSKLLWRTHNIWIM